MKVIYTPNAPAAIGPYSQGYEVNGFVYTSGQIGVNPADGVDPRASRHRHIRAARMLVQFWKPAALTSARYLRPPASWQIWLTLQHSTLCMSSISSPSPQEAAWL